LQLEVRTDDGYGWYNFDTWYRGELKLNRNLSAIIKLTPNKFLNNTFLFQNDKEFNFVIDIEIKIGAESCQDNSNYLKSIILDKFDQFLSNVHWKFLEVPFHKENKIELEKIVKTFEE
jgi:hypothetical protein